MASALVGEQGQVESAITVVEEGFLAVVPPLRNVVRCADRDHASMAWHDRELRTDATAVSKLRLSKLRLSRFSGLLINGFNLNAAATGDCEVETDSTGMFGRLRELLEAELPFRHAIDRNPWTGYGRKLARLRELCTGRIDSITTEEPHSYPPFAPALADRLLAVPCGLRPIDHRDIRQIHPDGGAAQAVDLNDQVPACRDDGARV